jgi:HEAT repeat protein
MSGRMIMALLGSALLLSACASYDKLIQHDPTVDEQEVYAGGVDGDADEIVPHLIYVLQHRDEFGDEVVVAALASLAERPDSRAVEAVAGLARDPNEEVRWHVALALKAIGGDLAKVTLAEMAAGDESEMVRDEAMA